MTVLIFANGEVNVGPWIRPHVQNASVVIAANGGIHHLQALDLTPDLIIGDLDSADGELIASLVRSGARTIRYSADKDETDLELALFYAQRNFEGSILVFGATGGRIDHNLANLLLLAHPDLLQSDISYIDLGVRLWIVHDQTSINGEAGDLISLIPINGQAKVTVTKGLRWPLNNEILEFGPTRGISNELTGQSAEIDIASGTIICIHTKKRMYGND